MNAPHTYTCAAEIVVVVALSHSSNELFFVVNSSLLRKLRWPAVIGVSLFPTALQQTKSPRGSPTEGASSKTGFGWYFHVLLVTCGTDGTSHCYIKYMALIAELEIAKEKEVIDLFITHDTKLVCKQVVGEW